MEAVMDYMMDFYFESAAMILTLITVGKMLEARSEGKDHGCTERPYESGTEDRRSRDGTEKKSPYRSNR